jgi:arginase family enzyme
LSLSDVSDLLAGVLASPRVVALEVCEYQPLNDPDRVHARALVGLIARAVARHLRG